VKNITLSAPEPLIEAARKQALAQHSTLNAEFRKWLEDFSQRQQKAEDTLAILRKISSYASSGGRKFTRDEMNERR
jgi:hypothetical protein